jgi:hypothetical protein
MQAIRSLLIVLQPHPLTIFISEDSMKFRSFSRRSMISAIGIVLCAVFFVIVMSRNVSAQYTGTGNHTVSLTDARAYIQKYRSHPVAPANKGVYFDRNIYEKILAQPGCVGIRQYFAQKDDNAVTLVMVGVDVKGNDMIDGTIGELAQICPPLCAPDTQLY